MSNRNPDGYQVKTIIARDPDDTGIIRNEDREPPKPRERQPSNDLSFVDLIAANEQTYRRNNVVSAIDYFLKHHPESITHFEGALADASEELYGNAAEG